MKRTVLKSFVAFVVAATSSGVAIVAGSCSSAAPQNYTYSQAWRGYYKLYTDPAIWDTARQTCELDGATLATPRNLKQAAQLLSIIKGHELACALYIGLRRTQPKGYFNTMDGVPLCHLPHQWAEKEPDATSAPESCAVLQPSGTLADEPCTESRPFVCYKRQQPCYTCRDLCRTRDSGYRFEQRTGSCYKFHRDPKTWGDAVDICSNEGGHLVIINSDTESRVLKELFAQHPPDSIQGTMLTSVLHVGFHQLFKKNCWRNIDGFTLRGSGFRTWAPRQPDAGGGREDPENCGSILRSGLLNDVSCNAKCAFVCEMNISPTD